MHAQEEEAELMEFEMLEKAADENSFSSQNSLVMHVLTSGRPLTPEPRIPKPPPSTSSHSRSRSGTGSPLTRATTAREHLSETETVRQSRRTDTNRCISDPGDIRSTLGIHSQNRDPILPPVCDSPLPSDNSSFEEDLDETLRPSLAAGVDFNDEEAWESFNRGSPPGGRGQLSASSGSVTPDAPVLSAPWSSPVRREQLDQRGRAVFSSPLPTAALHGSAAAEHAATNFSQRIQFSGSAETNDRILPSGREALSSAALRQNTSPITLLQSSSTTTESKPPDRSSLAHLPPPSALVSKLFPALRKEREESKKQALQQLHVVTSTPTNVASSSTLRPLSATSQDSGRGSGQSSTPSPPSSSSSVPVAMNEELRQKLYQLESEIERFRAENASLEKLRFQKEQVSMM